MSRWFPLEPSDGIGINVNAGAHFRVEIFLLIVCGSIPTLKPLYDELIARRGFRRLFSSRRPLLPSKESHPSSSGHASLSVWRNRRDVRGV